MDDISKKYENLSLDYKRSSFKELLSFVPFKKARTKPNHREVIDTPEYSLSTMFHS